MFFSVFLLDGVEFFRQSLLLCRLLIELGLQCSNFLLSFDQRDLIFRLDGLVGDFQRVVLKVDVFERFFNRGQLCFLLLTLSCVVLKALLQLALMLNILAFCGLSLHAGDLRELCLQI